MDFLLPNLGSSYTSMLDGLKSRDEDILKWFDGTSSTNLPSGAKRWNSTNSYWEKFNGTVWSPLATKYLINVDQVDGCTVNDNGTTITDLWTANKIVAQLNTKVNTTTYTASDILTKLKTVDGIGSGLDAELVNGKTSATTNTPNSVVIRDASGNFSAGTITASLTGNSSTATKLAASRTINITGDATGNTSFDGSSNVSIPVNVTSVGGIAPSTVNTGNTLVQRDSNGDIAVRSVSSTLNTTNSNINFVMTQVNQSTDAQVKPSTPEQLASALNPYISGGATGAGGDKIFTLNGQNVTTSYSIPVNNNAMSVGDIIINTGVTVTIPDGSRWVII